MGEPMIAFEDVHKSFGYLKVLKGIDLTIERGTAVAILGPSGSGKSTLVRCINRLEPIDAGRITVDGAVLGPDAIWRAGRRLSPRQVAQFRTHIGMVFQSFNLFPHLTVMGNIIEAPVGVLGWKKPQARERALDLLRKVNLEDKADAYPANLSGGQQQRAAIVRSLIMDPKVMLFDEPTSALDPELIGEVLQVIQNMAIQGRTSIIVTHEIHFAHEVASSIVFMDGGRIVEQGPPHEVLDNPKEPRTQAFLSRMA